jgi:PAS domain S-box-containing protein
VAIKDREGRVIGTVGISRDMSEQVRAEAEREEQRQMLRTLLDALPDLIVFKDRDSVYQLCNRTYCQFVDRPMEELIGKSDFDLFPLEDARRYREEEVQVLETGEPLVVEHQVKGPTGIFWEEVVKTPLRAERGEVIGVLTAGRDIRERKRLEAELVRAQKLESVGILAGGIAHDFNNLLTAILGNISLARTEARDKGEKDIEDILTTAERASMRAADLTRQLLTFARGGAPVKKTVSIAGSLPEWVEFALRGSNVRCQFAIAGDLWPVHADEGQISQVLHNLVLNARQAMPAGGAIRLAATNVTLRASLATLSPGRYVEMVLADDGTGIPEEHLPKIFDPYFTTRQKGSGLGLATAYSIIKNHQGYIEVESTLGQGATFRIYLPAAEQTKVKEQAAENVPLAGHGRVLAMDDEPALRALAQRVLKRSGYDVEVAADGAEAVEIYRQAQEAGQPFDLVVLDLTVPGGMGGLAALQKLREINSQVKAVVSSGYSTDPVMAEAARYGFQGVIAKPYRWDQFCQVVQDVLAEDAL